MNKYVAFFILGTLAFLFNCPPDLDLGRYYDIAEMLNANMSIVDYALDNFQENFDFIYFTSFLIVKKIGLPKEIVNFLYVGIYYFMSVALLELFTKDMKRGKTTYIRYLTFFMITSVGLYIIFSISRNLAAISFFLLGLNMLLKGRKYFFVLWILSIFTHVGMVLYISFFSLFYFIIPFPQLRQRKSVILLLSISALVLGKYAIVFLELVSNLSFFDTYSRFLIYTELEDADVSEFSTLGVAEVISYYFFCITIFYGFYFLKNYNKVVWAAFGVYFFLLFSLGFSVMFFQRSLMFLMPFQGIIAVCLYKENHKKSFIMTIYTVLTLISIMLFFGYLYSYRGNEMF